MESMAVAEDHLEFQLSLVSNLIQSGYKTDSVVGVQDGQLFNTVPAIILLDIGLLEKVISNSFSGMQKNQKRSMSIRVR